MSTATRVKELNEQRGAKLKLATELSDKVTQEKRAYNSEELTKMNGFLAEVDTIEKTLEVELRKLEHESRQPVKLSTQEKRDVDRFDYRRLLNHIDRAFRGMPANLDGIEAEMIQEGEKEVREANIQVGGIVLPRILVRRGGYEARDMTATGQTSVALDQGGMTIATAKAGLLDDFFNASVLRNAGATVLEGLVGNLDVPRIVAGTAPTKETENANADEVSPTTAQVSLTPGRLPAYIDVSDRLLLQSSTTIEAFLRAHLTNQMLAVQEAAFFHGGGTDEPEGIAGTSGIGSVAGGTNGLAPTWAHIVALETAVDTSNALLGNLRYFSNGQVRGKLKTTPKVSGTDSVMILDPDRGSGMLNGYPQSWTNAISRTLTKGSSGAVASAIFFGNAADYWIGYWSGISLEMVRDKTTAIAGLRTLVASAYYDGGLVRPKSFAAMLDALAA